MESLTRRISDMRITRAFGKVVAVKGLGIEIGGPTSKLAIGAQLQVLHGRGSGRGQGRERSETLVCEVIGFRDGRAVCMAFGSLSGVRPGDRAEVLEYNPVLYPSSKWIGRVVDGMGNPLDGKGPLPTGPIAQPFSAAPPPAHERRLVGNQMDLGLRSFNTFLPCCEGQRMGIFAGSGVGKSMLMSMLARNAKADIAVIGLIGERGREVQDFLVKTLGAEGLKKSIVVVATSDAPALMRRQAAYATMALSEYFSQQGKQVLCLMDNLTRFAQAQREIGLSVGEPPTAKGYPPSVFSELPQLLERAGPGRGKEGNITGLFAVLVEGDNTNEPISDAVRGILDGHVILSRDIAERGRYPAIDALASVSRTFTDALSKEQQALIAQARVLMSRYRDMEELIRLGAYRKGSDPITDEAVKIVPRIETFLSQNRDDVSSIEESFALLGAILAEATVTGDQIANANNPVAK
ncbi:MAG: flagellar protein export ATPase FliI [Rhizobiales bacterium]|nr:flagellar protein export ATPase FliI [Hyphomicrobiales bacterium]